MPTVLSLGQPATAFQFAYMLYLYGQIGRAHV